MAKTRTKTGQRLTNVDKYLIEKNPENLTAAQLAELTGASLKSVQNYMSKLPAKPTGTVHEGVVNMTLAKKNDAKIVASDQSEHKQPTEPIVRRHAAIMTKEMSEMQDDFKDNLHPKSGFYGNPKNIHVINPDKPTM